MDNSQKITLQLLFTIVFVPIVALDLYGEYTNNPNIVFIAKPLITLLVIAIYWYRSSLRSSIFVSCLLFGLVSTILFIPNNPTTLLWGVGVFAFHRLLLIIFLLRLLRPINYIPILIASLPILFIFFYLVYINVGLDTISLLIFSINNVLISFFCGIIIANYMMKDENNNSWLLISALMFLALQLIVYIEKFYLLDFSPRILRPTAVFFLALAMLTLVRGVLSQERLNNDASS